MKTQNQIKYLAVILVFLGLVFIDHRVQWDWIYTHWLYDYHFGFMKRSLVGAIVGSFFPASAVVPLAKVRALAWLIWAGVSGVFFFFFLDLAKKITDVTEKKNFFWLFAFCWLAPISLRDYAYDLGRFDQLGILLLFLQWWSIPALVTAVLAAMLVFIHEGFIFIFLPAILLLVFLKKGWRSTFWVAAFAGASTLFIFKFGKPATDMATLWAYLQSKADAPLDHNIELFYRSFVDQLQVNWLDTKNQLPHLAGYLLYLYFLTPLLTLGSAIRWKVETIWFKRLILFGYAIIFVLTCDWCRHTTNAFLVLSFLLLYFMREAETRTRVLTHPYFQRRNIKVLTVLSAFIPAAGVEIPRIEKLKIVAPIFRALAQVMKAALRIIGIN
jgi:hypothetical protein